MSCICIFGNSHLGALAQSPDALKQLDAVGHDVFFWGLAGSNFEKLAVTRTEIVSPVPAQSMRISGGRFEHLDLTVPDTIVFYGMNVGPSYQARNIAITMQMIRNISSGLRNALIKQEIERGWNANVASVMISAVTGAFPDKRYLFAPQPLVAEHNGFLDRVPDTEALFEIQQHLFRHYETWMAARGVTFFRQPDHTITDRFFTKSDYTKDSVRLASDKAHEVTDMNHMNPDYGAIMLAEIARLVT